LTFQHDPQAVRLDHFLATRGDRLAAGQRLEILRQFADPQAKLYVRIESI
jgi:hypothetical protein